MNSAPGLAVADFLGPGEVEELGGVEGAQAETFWTAAQVFEDEEELMLQ